MIIYFWCETLRPPPFVDRYGRKDGRGSGMYPEWNRRVGSGRFLPEFINYKKMKESRVGVALPKILFRSWMKSRSVEILYRLFRLQRIPWESICLQEKCYPMIDVGNYTEKSGGENRQRAGKKIYVFLRLVLLSNRGFQTKKQFNQPSF